MGRLIDADALIVRLRNESVIPFSKMLLNDEHRWFLKLEDMIKTQPTAYDIEKVVAELEDAKWEVSDWRDTMRNNIIEDCIKIVRKGGAK